MNELFYLSIIVVFFYMTLFYIMGIVSKDNSIVDVAWGLGFVLLTFLAMSYSTELSPRQVLIAILVTIWGLRLSSYLLKRKIGNPEEFRYKKYREIWRLFELRSFFQIYMLRGFFMLIIALPILLVNIKQNPLLGGADYIGLTLWIIGFYFESLADYQKVQFKKDPSNKNKLLTDGLWKYSRNPNYFGECLMWLGIGIMSTQVSWWGMISPLFLTITIITVTGVPIWEEHYKGRKDWENYKKKTSSFIPWFPR